MARVVSAAAAMIIAAQLVAGGVRAETPDADAVAAYVELLESLHQEGLAIGDRIYGSRRTVDAFNEHRIDGAELTRILDPVFDALHGELNEHRHEVVSSLKPPPTGDQERDRNLLTTTLTVALISDNLASKLTAANNLRLSAVRHDAAGYHRAETDVLELRAAVYNATYLFLASRLVEFEPGDPMHGIYLASMGVASAGEKNFRYLTKSTRTGSFDSAAYTSSIEYELRRIAKGLAEAEAAMADPSWPAMATTGDAGTDKRRREAAIELARQYFTGLREFSTATRRSLESLRAASAGGDKLSGPEMRKPVHMLRLDIEWTFAAVAEVDRIRLDLAELGRAP